MDEPNPVLHLLKKRAAEPAETAPVWIAKRRLAAELRRMGNALCSSDASEAEVLAMADLVAGQADLLERVRAPRVVRKGAPAAVPGMQDFIDRGPIAGRSNPVSPPALLRVDVDVRRVVGEVEFGRAFEGAPGCVHGGLVAAVLDEALGMACIFGGGPAMTAELTTRFLRHTPIETPLEVEAWLDEVDGKKVRTSGKVAADGETLLESTGLFIAVGAEKFAALLGARSEGEPAGPEDRT